MLAESPTPWEDEPMDFSQAGLLDGLQGERRAAREQLLAQLVDDGFSLDELNAAVAENRLALLPVERVLGSAYSARELEGRAALPASLLLRIRRLTGLPEAGPDDRVFGEEDIAAAESTKRFLEAGLPEEVVFEITRVIGEGMSRAAATTTTGVAGAFLQPGDTERDVALRYASLAEQLLPSLTPVLVSIFKAHLRESVRRGMLGRTELESGQIADAQEMAICFADLVGFTRLGGEIEVEELGTVASRLADLATEVTVPPVRLVKTIGDAAMFVSPNPAAMVAVALSLTNVVEEAELPSLRAGVACGPALVRAGDFYGHTVNLASRVTGTARPGSVLCTADVHEAARAEFQWSFVGSQRLKGVAQPVRLYRARELASRG